MIRKLQDEQALWAKSNFGPQTQIISMLGLTEELGELARAELKKMQGVRNGTVDFEAKAKDAVGDIFIFLLGYCTANGWDLEDVVNETWHAVQQRNWRKYPKNGRTE